ncbi:hypothetical protein QBC39DRAFT_184874 [Podospora conica]|nr:hypothetical protein QBC39DRAFT_184874 [Schizothecium conicum]
MPSKSRPDSRLWNALHIVLRKALRIGPRALPYLAICLVMFIILTKLISNRHPQYNGTTKWWWSSSTGTAPSPIGTVTDVRLDTIRLDDLRVVVFGGQDVATPDDEELVSAWDKAPSWTEVLCNKLNCSTHLSFIPAGGNLQHPMISPEIYAVAVEKLLQETDPSRGPGENHTSQLDHFPIPSRVPGLADQVTALLDTDAAPGAADTPETLWVFTFGTWEVWSLATFPLELSKPFVTLMTRTIFEQADRLYETLTGSQHDAMFRILVPELFDPSLLPAWKTSRPRLGRGHPPALQMRNAMLLTKHWNQEVHERMDQWVLGEKAVNGTDRPLRDGFVFDLPGYLVDAITEGQMRQMGEPRARPASEGYRDVSRPCASQGRAEKEVQACEAAGDHLFSTPFVAGTRAARDIGTLAAEMVQNNKSQRALGHYIPPPRVGAWFESWELGYASRQGKTRR